MYVKKKNSWQVQATCREMEFVVGKARRRVPMNEFNRRHCYKSKYIILFAASSVCRNMNKKLNISIVSVSCSIHCHILSNVSAIKHVSMAITLQSFSVLNINEPLKVTAIISIEINTKKKSLFLSLSLLYFVIFTELSI